MNPDFHRNTTTDKGATIVTHHAKASSAGSTMRGGSRLGRIVRGVFATRAFSPRAKGTGAPSAVPAHGTGAPSAPRPCKRLALTLAALVLLAVSALAASLALAASPPGLVPGTAGLKANGEVILRGAVNPGGTEVTNCHFAYGLTPSYGETAPCSPSPGSGNEGVAVEATIANLEPGATYHFTLSATSAGGTEELEDATFEMPKGPSEESCPNEQRRVEQHATYLPDCRAYEMVSPSNKNGGEVLRTNQRTRVAADGNAFGFASLNGFAGTEELGVATDYLSERSTSPEPGNNGWSTHALIPTQPTLSLVATLSGEEPLYTGPYSSADEKGVLYASAPLTEDPAVAKVPNLYLRTNLRSSGEGSYQLLTACPRCEEPGGEPLAPAVSGQSRTRARPEFVAATSDFGHVLFESVRNLTADAPAQPPLFKFGPFQRGCSLAAPPGSINGILTSGACAARLYESENGTLRLAGVVPETVQSLTVSATSGAFALSFKGEETEPIPFNASAATVQSELNSLHTIDGEALGEGNLTTGSTTIEGLSTSSGSFVTGDAITGAGIPTGTTIANASTTNLTLSQPATATATGVSLSATSPEPGSVSVSGGPGDASGSNPYLIAFGGGLGGVGVPLLSSNPSGLSGGSETAEVALSPRSDSCGEGQNACAAADGSAAGWGAKNAFLTPGVLSDGSDGHFRAFFTQPTNEAGETVRQVFVTQAGAINQSASGLGNLFVRTDHATTEQLNVSERATPEASRPAAFLDASADGSRAFFETKANLTEDAEGSEPKLYMWSATPDGQGHHLTLINRDEEPNPEAFIALIGVSNDGHYVYFMQRGALVKNGPDGGVDWIWLWHDGKLTPVAPAPPNQTAQYEDYATGIQWPLRPSQVKVSSNGNLLFSTISGQGLVGYDHGSCNTGLGIGCRELYLYSAATGQVACVSCIPSGAPGEGEGAGRMSTLQFGNTSDSITGGTKADRPNWLPLSRDGSRVFFSTTQALVPEDTNGKFDAYEYDVKTGQVHLLSSGTSKYDSYFVNADAEGRNVFIVTNQQLLGWDHDQGYDVYDARVNGGFPEPLPVPAPCNGESCHRSLPPNPSVPSIGSSLEGPGNPKQQRPPKKKHHHRRRHHRAARANRRVAR